MINRLLFEATSLHEPSLILFDSGVPLDLDASARDVHSRGDHGSDSFRPRSLLNVAVHEEASPALDINALTERRWRAPKTFSVAPLVSG